GELVAWLERVVGHPASSAAAAQAEWLFYRGEPSRNGRVDGGLPHLRVHWKSVPLLPYPELESLVDDTVVELRRQSYSTEFATFPLAVDNRVITRTVQGLMAFDFYSGKLLWRAGENQNPISKSWFRAGLSPLQDGMEIERSNAFTQHLWRNRLFGVLSSDGERVFAIDHLQIPVTGRWQAPVARGPGGRAGGMPRSMARQSPINNLSAYELAAEGRLAWQLDGVSGPEPLQDAFFLGAPLVLGQSLYGLAEIKGAIFLIVLEAESGKFIWRQQLVSLEKGIESDPFRRLMSTSPSFDSGILVCPTGVGVVVGVNLSMRSLAWAYRY
ncbi:MAG: hypothetical protein N2C12_18155, partial [Planctomycetales bacterium]